MELHESWNKKVKNLSSSLKGLDAPYSISHKLGYIHGASDFQAKALEFLEDCNQLLQNDELTLKGMEFIIKNIKNLRA